LFDDSSSFIRVQDKDESNARGQKPTIDMSKTHGKIQLVTSAILFSSCWFERLRASVVNDSPANGLGSLKYSQNILQTCSVGKVA
jgi:hypothetical protein